MTLLKVEYHAYPVILGVVGSVIASIGVGFVLKDIAVTTETFIVTPLAITMFGLFLLAIAMGARPVSYVTSADGLIDEHFKQQRVGSYNPQTFLAGLVFAVALCFVMVDRHLRLTSKGEIPPIFLIVSTLLYGFSAIFVNSTTPNMIRNQWLGRTTVTARTIGVFIATACLVAGTFVLWFLENYLVSGILWVTGLNLLALATGFW